MVPFANGHWDRALSRFWLLTPLRSISIYTLEAESVPVLDGMNLLENHDISFRRNELQCSIETLSVRASDSEFTVYRDLASSCLSHAAAGDLIEDPREQN